MGDSFNDVPKMVLLQFEKKISPPRLFYSLQKNLFPTPYNLLPPMTTPNLTFITKVITILQNPLYQVAISWSDSGKYIEIKDERRLQEDVLEKEFKHNKVGSFIRQLNMYGFKKMKNTRHLSFIHQSFQKDDPAGLLKIKRRKNCKEVEKVERERREREVKQQQRENEKQQTLNRIEEQLKKPVALPPFLCPFDINHFNYLPEFPHVMKAIENNWFEQFTKFVRNLQ